MYAHNIRKIAIKCISGKMLITANSCPSKRKREEVSGQEKLALNLHYIANLVK
jgi:hypothetical protein